MPDPTLVMCGKYLPFALSLSKWFLALALLVAVIETALLLAAKLKALLEKPPASDPTRAKTFTDAGIDPVKLIDAVKGLLETLKGLPAWVALFLAGLALLWVAAVESQTCKPIIPNQPTGATAGSQPLPTSTTAPASGAKTSQDKRGPG
jgi:hypothetical protein